MTQRTQPLMHGFRSAALLLVVLLHAPFAQAQKLKERMAQRHEQVFDYPKVASIYENLDAKGKADADDLRKLAATYTRMGQSAKAEGAYQRLVAMPGHTPADELAYADQLRNNG